MTSVPRGTVMHWYYSCTLEGMMYQFLTSNCSVMWMQVVSILNVKKRISAFIWKSYKIRKPVVQKTVLGCRCS